MTKITRNIRKTINAIIAASCDYDASTIRITRDGEVTARKDADKTYAGNDPARYVVGHVDDMVDTGGTAREGWL